MTHPLKVHRQRLKSYSRIALLMKQRAMRCLWDSMKCKRNVDNSRLSINRHHISWLVYLSNLSLLSAKWLLFIRTINKSTLFQPETERMFAIHYERLIFMKPGAQRGVFDCHRTKGWMEESILVNEISNWSIKFLGLTFKGSKFVTECWKSIHWDYDYESLFFFYSLTFQKCFREKRGKAWFRFSILLWIFVTRKGNLLLKDS